MGPFSTAQSFISEATMFRGFTITISLLAALAAALGWPEILCFATTADAPLRLSNSHLALSFDRQTGHGPA